MESGNDVPGQAGGADTGGSLRSCVKDAALRKHRRVHETREGTSTEAAAP